MLFLLILLCFTRNIHQSFQDVKEFPKQIISKNLEDFINVSNYCKTKNIVLNVGFSVTKFGIDGATVSLNRLNLQSNWKNPTTTHLETTPIIPLEYVFKLANQLEINVVASSEYYNSDGGLRRITLNSEDVSVVFDKGVTKILYENTEGEVRDEDDKAFEDYFNLVKDHELPVDLSKTDYDNNGKILSTYSERYRPTKVKILSSTMLPEMQFVVAEALKRTCIMKNGPLERLKLLTKYLDMRFNKYEWQACICKGNNYVADDVKIKLELGGEHYTIWGEKI